MKSLQLSALKSAEKFVIAEVEQREAGGPSACLSNAVETKQIIQRAIVDAEIQPDLRVEMLETLKHCLELFGEGHALSRFNWGASFLRAEDIRELNELPGAIADVIKRAEG